jgi:hypothetical protein
LQEEVQAKAQIKTTPFLIRRRREKTASIVSSLSIMLATARRESRSLIINPLMEVW